MYCEFSVRFFFVGLLTQISSAIARSLTPRRISLASTAAKPSVATLREPSSRDDTRSWNHLDAADGCGLRRRCGFDSRTAIRRSVTQLQRRKFPASLTVPGARFPEERMVAGIDLSHATKVAPKVALGDEIARHGLLHERGMAAGHRRGWRRNGAADPVESPDIPAGGREQYFAEASSEQHQSVAVESLRIAERDIRSNGIRCRSRLQKSSAQSSEPTPATQDAAGG